MIVFWANRRIRQQILTSSYKPLISAQEKKQDEKQPAGCQEMALYAAEFTAKVSRITSMFGTTNPIK